MRLGLPSAWRERVAQVNSLVDVTNLQSFDIATGKHSF